MAVHRQKQHQLSRVALWFLREKRLHNVRARFDVVAISGQNDLNEVHHFKNAFDMVQAG